MRERKSTNRHEDDLRVANQQINLNLKIGEKSMCKSMTEFEQLVQSIQTKKEEIDKIKKELAEQEEELKSYMKKRQKEELVSKSTGLTVSYKAIESMKFNKDFS